MSAKQSITLPREDVEVFVAMMEMVWEAVPWGKTFNLDVALLNDGELARERIKARLKAEAK